MHGVKRTQKGQKGQDRIEAKKKHEQGKIKEYLSLSEAVLSKRNTREWSNDALKMTTSLLELNPEFYTIWNYRRNILVKGVFPASSRNSIYNILLADLNLTLSVLKSQPKVYWIWNHRRWCLDHIPDGPDIEENRSNIWRKACWDKELYFVEKMLDLDPRNFHAWDYRRYVLENRPSPSLDLIELEYTTRKIESNFSNFSAWHQRSAVLQKLWNAGTLDVIKSKDAEFRFIKNAMYTDPGDQSVWIYHRWLIGSGDNADVLKLEIAAIEELLDEQPNSKWCIESIIQCNLLLLKNHASSVDAQVIKAQCLSLLKQLGELDVARRRRYEDLSGRTVLVPMGDQ